MKMEHVIVAPLDGEVKSLNAKVGDRVEDGFELAVVA